MIINIINQFMLKFLLTILLILSAKAASVTNNCSNNQSNNSNCINCSIRLNCTAPLVFNGYICDCNMTTYLSVNSSGQNVCLQCPSNCINCSNQSCFSCRLGFYVDPANNSCQNCSPNCSICLNSTFCLMCFSEFGISWNAAIIYSNTCQKLTLTYINFSPIPDPNAEIAAHCPTVSCLACDAQKKCLTCKESFALVGELCLPCPKGCRICSPSPTNSNLLSCNFCWPGNFLTQPNCTACIDNRCLECINPCFCTKCWIGFYNIVQLGNCKPCGRNCNYCINQSACNANGCAIGFKISRYSPVCIRCFSGFQSCEVSLIAHDNCTSEQINITSCDYCPPYKSCPTSKIFPLLITDYTFLLTQKSYCIWSFNNGSFNCSRCLDGWTMNNSTCVKRIDDCPFDSVLVLNICYPCNLSSTFCRTTDEDFLKLNNSKYALECQVGFYKNKSSIPCQACPIQCLVCSQSNQCTLCSPGYFLHPNSNGISLEICAYCNQICKTCVLEPHRCTSCNTGYTLFKFICLPDNKIFFALQIQSLSLLGLDVSKDIDFFMTDLASKLGRPFNESLDTILIKNLTRNQTITFSSDSPLITVKTVNSYVFGWFIVDADVYLARLQTKIRGIKQIGGILIKSFNLTSSQPTKTSVNFAEKAMILLIIPAVLVFEIIVTVLCQYLSKREQFALMEKKKKNQRERQEIQVQGMPTSNHLIALTNRNVNHNGPNNP